MKRILFLFILMLVPAAAAAQEGTEPFNDFLHWREAFKFVTSAKDVLSVATTPGNETYFVKAERSNGSLALESDMDAIFDTVDGRIVPEYAQQIYAGPDGVVVKRFHYEWESPMMTFERQFSGDIPDDLAQYPFRRVGNGAGVYDPVMIFARLRRGGSFIDITDATVVYAGKSYYINYVQCVPGYIDDIIVLKYTVHLSEKSFLKLSVEAEGYRRPMAFEVKIGDYKLKGRLDAK